MGEKKKLFASLRYIVPSELEEFLEQQASEGMILRFLSQGSLFYFTFASEEPEESAEGTDGSEGICGKPPRRNQGLWSSRVWIFFH